jgi:hypothetical protein
LWSINTDHIIESNLKKQLASLLTTYNLQHTINFAIKIQNNSSTAIDNLFVDNSRINLSSVSPIISDQSEHDTQILTIKNVYATTTQISFKAENHINRQS